MDWLIENLVPMTIASVAVTVLLLVLIYRLISRWESKSWVKFVATSGPAIVIAATVGPMFNHAWAMKRDDANRAWTERLAHLERFRPVLREDGNRIREMSEGIAK